MKILFLIITFWLSLFSDIKFTETKYLSALDMDMTKYGSMNYENNILKLFYTNPSKEEIIYYEDKLTLQSDENEITAYTYIEHPQLEYFGILLKSIISNNYDSLENMFEITVENNTKILTAKSSVSGTINYLEVIYKNKNLHTIIFYMANEDKITIETIN